MKTKLLRRFLVLALGCQAITTNADSRNWTGNGALVGGVFKVWSDADNWSPNGSPQAGEDLWFDDNVLLFSPTPMFNDLTNLTVRSLRFSISADFFTPDWELSGNTLTVTNDVRLDASDGENVSINCGLRLGGNVRLFVNWTAQASELHVNGAVDLNGHNLLLTADSDGLVEVNGIISGTGSIYVDRNTDSGGGTVKFSGVQGNTFQGTVTLRDSPGFFGGVVGPKLVLDKQSGVAVTGNLVMERQCILALGRSEQIGDNSTVRVGGGSAFLLQDHAESIQSLELTTDSSDSGPAILDAGSGGLLGLYGSITAIGNNSSQISTIKGKITLTPGEHTIYVGGSVYAGLDMQAQILGDGNFSKTGNSALLLTASNSCNSTISVVQGILDVRHFHALGDTAGPTQLFGGALLLRNVAIAGETLFALGQGTGGTFPGSVLTSVGACSWSGPVLLNTNLVVSGDMDFSGVISGAGGLGCFGLTTVHLTANNTYTGTNYISGATLQVDGVQPLSPVDLHDQGRLQGPGMVGNINVKGVSTAIAPGSGPGILTCNNLDASGGNGQLEIELNGTTPGTGYDQLNVNGSVNLTGLSLSGSRSFSPAQGETFTIINNDGTDPVSGTFTGLRQDSQVRIGNESFYVNYTGGTGNDVVLTRLGYDITWTNSVSGDWNVAANWSPNRVPGTNDTAFINKTVTVTLNTTVNCYNLSMGISGGSPTLTGAGDLTLFAFDLDGFNLTGSLAVNVRHQMNWTGGTMSGSGRTIIAPGATLTIPSIVTLNTRTLENGGTILWTGGNVSMSGGVITNRAGALFDARTTTGLNYASNPGSRFDNAGTFRKSIAGTTTLFGGLAFNNYGAVEIQAGTLTLFGGGTHTGTFDVPAGTTLNLSGGTHTASVGSSITGAGNLYVSGGNPHTFAGLVNVSGTNQFDSGTANVTGNYICTNNTLFMSGGTANFNGTGTMTPAMINMDSGVLGGSQNVTVLSQMNWTGGTMTGSGRTFIPAGVTLNIASTFATVSLTGGRTLENGGTILWTGGNFTMSSAVITNRVGALFEARNALGLNYTANPGSRFDNAGTFRKSVVVGTTTVGGGMAFNNYNAVEIQTGTLALSGGGTNGGTYDILAGATLSLFGGAYTDGIGSSITGAGNFTVGNGATPTLVGFVDVTGTNTFGSSSTVNLTGNYFCTNNTLVIASPIALNFNGTGTVTPAVLNFTGGTLSGSQTVTVLSHMNWTGGTMTGSGRTIILPGASLNIAANASTISLTGGRTLENGGAVLWTAGNFLMNGASITNRAGALFEVQNALGLNYLSSPGSRFDNAGTFRKSVNPGTTTVGSGMIFNNYNTLDIQSGILVANGGFVFPASSRLYCALGGTTAGTGHGRLQVAGPVTLNGDLGVSLANGFLPTTNDTFMVLTAGTRSGTFANFYFPSNEVTMLLSNTVNSVIVSVSTILVQLPPPILQIEGIAPTAARLSWSTNYPDFHLESNTNLGSANWAASVLIPVVTSTNFVITNSVSGVQQYYRLSRGPAP